MSGKSVVVRNEEEEMMMLRRYVTMSIVGLFVFNTLCAVSCIFFVGFGLMNLPGTLIHYLMAQTIGQGAAVVLLIARSMFPMRVVAKRRPARGLGRNSPLQESQ